MAVKWKASKYPGVRYYEHAEREIGVGKNKRPDQYFAIRYQNAGKRREEGLGWATEGWSEGRANEELTSLKKAARTGEGERTLQEKRHKQEILHRELEAKRRQEITVEELISLFIEDHSKRKKRSWEEDERALRKDLEPWFTWRVKDVARRDAKALLDAIDSRGAPVQAFNILCKARKMWNMAIRWEYTESNPFAMQDPPRPYVPRNRVLEDGEIKTLWAALETRDGLTMSAEMSRALRLILVTAQRPGEVIGMHSREIEGRWWTIPAERSKNKNTHRVYLSDLALELIGEVPKNGFIFPSPANERKKTNQHIAENALALSLRRNILGASAGHPAKGAAGRNKKQAARKAESPPPVNRIGVEHFRPHDLRRTAVTGMARLRIPREDRERVVNHAVGKLEKTYNLYDFDEEKKVALIRWAAHLQGIITGSKELAKVVNLFPGQN